MSGDYVLKNRFRFFQKFIFSLSFEFEKCSRFQKLFLKLFSQLLFTNLFKMCLFLSFDIQAFLKIIVTQIIGRPSGLYGIRSWFSNQGILRRRGSRMGSVWFVELGTEIHTMSCDDRIRVRVRHTSSFGRKSRVDLCWTWV